MSKITIRFPRRISRPPLFHAEADRLALRLGRGHEFVQDLEDHAELVVVFRLVEYLSLCLLVSVYDARVDGFRERQKGFDELSFMMTQFCHG